MKTNIKKYILALGGVFLLGTGGIDVQAEQAGRILEFQSTVEQSVQKSGIFSGVIDPLNELQQLDKKLDQLRIDLQYEEELNFPSTQKIKEFSAVRDQKAQEVLDFQNKLKSLQAEEFVVPKPAEGEELEKGVIKAVQEKKEENIKAQEALVAQIDALMLEIKRTEEQIAEQDNLHNERKAKQSENIARLQREINQAEEAITKQKQLIESQWHGLLMNVGLFIGLIVVLFGMRFLLIKIFDRVSSAMHIHRKTVLIHILRVSFNIIIVVTVLGVLFSQVFSIIPFVALVGTGIAFALRDSISSFFAWFFIGTENGYKVGDVIRADDVYGRVKEINPFFTVLRQRHDEAESGNIMTIPNKYFLEKKIVNLSRFQNFTQVRLNFLLTSDSDFEKAKELLRSTIVKHNQENIEALHKYDKKLTRDFKLEVADLEPYVWYEPGDKGVELKAKFFAAFLELNRTRHGMIEEFTNATKKLKTVNIHFG